MNTEGMAIEGDVPGYQAQDIKSLVGSGKQSIYTIRLKPWRGIMDWRDAEVDEVEEVIGTPRLGGGGDILDERDVKGQESVYTKWLKPCGQMLDWIERD